MFEICVHASVYEGGDAGVEVRGGGGVEGLECGAYFEGWEEKASECVGKVVHGFV